MWRRPSERSRRVKARVALAQIGRFEASFDRGDLERALGVADPSITSSPFEPSSSSASEQSTPTKQAGRRGRIVERLERLPVLFESADAASAAPPIRRTRPHYRAPGRPSGSGQRTGLVGTDHRHRAERLGGAKAANQRALLTHPARGQRQDAGSQRRQNPPGSPRRRAKPPPLMRTAAARCATCRDRDAGTDAASAVGQPLAESVQVALLGVGGASASGRELMEPADDRVGPRSPPPAPDPLPPTTVVPRCTLSSGEGQRQPRIDRDRQLVDARDSPVSADSSMLNAAGLEDPRVGRDRIAGHHWIVSPGTIKSESSTSS